MSTVSMTVTGVEALRAKILAHAKRVKDKQREVLKIGAVMVQSEAVKAVQHGPKSGHMYGKHQASAPGEAPATDTGQLVRNIGFEVHAEEDYALIVSRAPYSMALEFGTNDGHILPRPFMTPAFVKSMPIIKDLFAKAAKG